VALEPPPAPERVLLTVEEAAKRLGIGQSMAFQLFVTVKLSRCRSGDFAESRYPR
jgi:hypothetical protein